VLLVNHVLSGALELLAAAALAPAALIAL